ncbi:MAG: pectate lyase [Gammaproteobacteria bacterium]|nr:pectate lyase [Gammaproteobacteria bacterium]
MPLIRILIFFALFCSGALFAPDTTAETKTYREISVAGFDDIIRHWQKQNDQFSYSRYTPDQIVGIADNVLLYQRDNGGWPKNVDPSRILSEQEQNQIQQDKKLTDTTLDNRNTYPQIEYLCHVYSQTKDKRYRKAAEKGLAFLLDNQFDNGGWSHSPPSTDGYHGHITFADDVMPGVLGLLRKIAEKRAPFTFIDDALRSRINDALQKGDELLLQLQIRRGDILTAWAGQYDRKTLAPVGARSYELAGLVSEESVAVVRYLMSIEKPSEKIVQAIESAIAWFKASRLYGIKIEKVTAEHVRFTYHSSDIDYRVVKDKTAPPIWARFYEIETNKPFMANRDGKKVYRLQDVLRERRTGYTWYGYWPADLLNMDYPAWKKSLSTLPQAHATPRYHAVVDADYSGKSGEKVKGVPVFAKIAEALAMVPADNSKPFMINIRNGRYHEKLSVDRPYVHFLGESRKQTIISYNDTGDSLDAYSKPLGTWGSFTLRITAPDFRAERLTIENSFDYPANAAKKDDDPEKIQNAQAVALMTDGNSDRAVFRDIAVVGFQDSLFVNAGRSYFQGCRVLGHVDFIFGEGQAVFDGCEIVSRNRVNKNPTSYITAPGTPISFPYGLLFINSRFIKETADIPTGSVRLGRPWHPGANLSSVGSAIFLDCYMDNHIGAEGYAPISAVNASGERVWFDLEPYSRFFEYGSYGPGAVSSSTRPQLSKQAAGWYTTENVLNGWIPD